MKNMLIIDDDNSILKMLTLFFQNAGYKVRSEQQGMTALALLDIEIFDIVITDLMLGDISGMEILEKAKKVSPKTEVIIITGHSSVDTAVKAMKDGAFDYITKPVDVVELNVVVQKAQERQQMVAEITNLRTQIRDYFNFDNIVAKSPAILNVLEILTRIAGTNSTVLIEGESGTGKEVVARLIHSRSLRNDGPFVAINCGALPETLLESELFGYIKGAFTGAHAVKKGLFEEANGGTIFLDEVGETSQTFQIKLLRVLQENEIRRIGDVKDIPVDVRVLASSNTPISKLVDAGRFRQDLYYRLRVIPLLIPPLRDRREDIVPLALFFIDRYCKKNNIPQVKLSKDAIQKIELSLWPGNVRELENTIERALVLAQGGELTSQDIFNEAIYDITNDYNFISMSLKEIEKMHIKRILLDCKWNQRMAAQRLGIGYNTLWRKIKEYNLKR